MARLRRQHEAKIELSQNALEAAKRERSHVEKENNELQQKVDENVQETSSVKQQTEELRRAHDENIEVVEDQFTLLEQQVRDYHRRVYEAMTQSSFALVTKQQ